MKNIRINIIKKENIHTILPLLQELNTTTPLEHLKKRLAEMITQNYECVGMYHGEKLIAISGLWTMTRHYIGRVMEPDHVIVTAAYRGKQLGNKLFEWIYDYAKQKGCEASELNAYSGNRKSHKFYNNEGYEIYGFHFIKVLRDDGEFY